MLTKQLLSSSFLIVFCSFFLFAQTDSLQSLKGIESQNLQLGISDSKMIDLLMPLMPGVGNGSRDLINEQTVKPYMMPPRKVGRSGALFAYSLASLLEYYVNFDQNFKDNLSPDYISLSTENKGIEEAFKFLALNGTVSAAIMPYDASAISSAVFNTQKYKINNYLHIFRDITNGRQKVFETRKALMRGNPVLIDMLVTEEFPTLNGANYWRPLGKKTETPVTVLVVSYDQDAEAFELYGTWGKEWGINGYLWVDYEDFGKFAQNGFVLIPSKKN